MHAVTLNKGGKQETFWFHIRNVTREHMELLVQQRRKQMVGQAVELSLIIDYYNDNHPVEVPIQTIFNFENDVAEFTQPEAVTAPLPLPSSTAH